MVVHALPTLVAATSEQGLPPEKAIVIILVFGCVFVASAVGLFASKKLLLAMANVIGSKQPIIARIACGIGVIASASFVVVATLKLLTLSGLCFFTLYRFLTDDKPSAAINWLVGCLALMLLGGAVFIFTRKPTHAPHRHDAKPAQAKGPPAKPAAPARSSPSVSGH